MPKLDRKICVALRAGSCADRGCARRIDPSRERLIELDVIDERVGLFGKQQKVA